MYTLVKIDGKNFSKHVKKVTILIANKYQTLRIVVKDYLLRKEVKLVTIFLHDQFLLCDQCDGGNRLFE